MKERQTLYFPVFVFDVRWSIYRYKALQMYVNEFMSRSLNTSVVLAKAIIALSLFVIAAIQIV